MNDSSIKHRGDAVESDSMDFSTGGIDDLDMATDAAEAAARLRKRFGLCFDATGSMDYVWTAATQALGQAVDEITKRSDVPVQIKVVAYRDHIYDAPHLVTEQTVWENDTQALKNFISGVYCNGGGDYPESIGHGLRQLIQQQCNQVILIGDAAGRHDSTGFDEAKIMGADKCPIFAMYTDDRDEALVRHFKKLAELSGGKAFLLKSGTDFMRDALSILFSKALGITYQPTTPEGIAAQKLIG